MRISFDPVILQLGLVLVRWYGLLLALGFLVAFLVAVRLATRRRLREDDLFSLMLWLLLGGVAGGRASYVLQSGLGPYLQQPTTLVTAWQTGLDFYGGLVGGFLAVLGYARLRGLALARLAEPAVVALPLGHAFTRLGCFLNGCSAGVPVASGPSVIYANPNALTTRLNTPLAPVQLYELAWDLLLLVAVVLALRHLRVSSVSLLCAYLAVYSLGRAGLYAWRDEPIVVGPFKVNQVVALAGALVAAAAGVAAYRQGPARRAAAVRLAAREPRRGES